MEGERQFIDVSKEPLNIIEKIKETPSLIIDSSIDTDIESRYKIASQIINQIHEYAMEKSEGDF
jgi:hypothetical protein